MHTILLADDHAPPHPYPRVMTTYTAELRSIPGFERCSRTELAALARSSERLDLPAGYTLVQPGDRWVGAIVVVEGEVIVETHGWTFLLTAGGRVERTETIPHDITVNAHTDTRVLTIERRVHAVSLPQPVG
jgi:CRP-like cAMP-binding protein